MQITAKVANKAEVVKSYLNHLFPSPKSELNYSNNFELLIAVILSARCTDKRVNLVTPNLFQKYPTPEKLMNADLSEVEKIIRSCGFFNEKAKSIISASEGIVKIFNGTIPHTMEELTTLKGVGRKTANVVLAAGFSIPAFAVDTHVFRVSKRFGLTKAKNVLDCEKDLMKIFDKSDWTRLHYQMVLFGRYYCPARDDIIWRKDFLKYENEYLMEK